MSGDIQPLNHTPQSGFQPLSAERSFALYVHIPFCVTKCPYCDFNSYALPAGYQSGEPIEQEAAYCEALIAEMRYFAQQTPWNSLPISSIFFGGGTPSLLRVDSLTQLLTAIADIWQWTEDIEITLEANPGTLRETLGKEKLAGFRSAGINRLSFGAQSLRAEKLLTLGRLHRVDDVYHSLNTALDLAYPRISLDLMYGLPNETAAQWAAELEQVLSLSLDHLSIYSLTIEPGTEFASQQRRGFVVQADEENLTAMYSNTQHALSSAGLRQYEVSNFARPGEECRHNLQYWRWQSYLGIGAGAHSFSRRCAATSASASKRWSNIPKPQHYVQRIHTQQLAAQRSEQLTLEQEKLEVLYCYLRTRYGFPLRHFEQYFGVPYTASFLNTQRDLQSEGLIHYDSDTIFLTSRGYLFSDYVLAQFAETFSDE